MNGYPKVIRKALDALYLTGGAVGAMFLLLMLAVIVGQMAARWFGFAFPGSTSYAGYCMAAASALALAYSLNKGAHIRVTLVLSSLGRWRRLGEIWCYGVGALTATFFARYAIKTVYWSHKLGDISQGQDATPLWIPQTALAVGASLLAIALIDHFIQIVVFNSVGIEEPNIAEWTE